MRLIWPNEAVAANVSDGADTSNATWVDMADVNKSNDGKFDFEKIRPWARGLRVMRLKIIGHGRGGHPWWAQPLFVMIK